MSVNNFPIGKLLIDGFEVRLKKLVVFLRIIINDCAHIVGGEGSRQDMNESEGSFEWFIHKMGEVILYLLSSLDVYELRAEAGQAINLLIFKFFILFSLLDFQTHVATDSTYVRVIFHVLVHFHESLSIRFQAHIQKNC